jgi:2-oxoglutarate ferredoxin oxidoreductase subunit beta
MPTVAELTTKEAPSWCAGCGDFTILSTLKSAIVELGIPQHQTLIVSGIGCGSKTPHYIKAYGFEGLHGRALPVATGAKLANHELNVIVVGGDGDGYGIGGNHLIHSMRRNFDMTYIVQNNEVYGLTKGQYSPTSEKGFKSPSTPNGAIEEPVNPIALALTMGATYVARGYAFDIVHLKKLIVEGSKHKGFALIDVFQPCSTYNKINTMAWYKQRIYKLEDNGHDTSNFLEAFAIEAKINRKLRHRFFRYDWQRRRMFVVGQRLHHGVTGIMLATLGGILIAHDWKDRSIWFRRGRQG